ncbi:UDP-N-acetylmuramyl peptide synthase [Gardnerella vaginalis]|uniref:UDP-N-acetylmuramyl peptide synthase n=1 Tax=Gardnerella vaginalis TaxID=2702 RepID=UPI0039EE6200
MNAVDEYSRVRVTLGFAAKNYGFEVVPSFAAGVTITSLAHDVRQVRPGCLFVPIGRVDRRQLEAARDAGAYAALVSPEFRNEASSLGMPLLVSSPNPVALGKLACDINADPSSCVATFAIAGDDDDEINANVLRLADFLHMLGNPVGVISSQGSTSLQRELSLQYPLNIADVQHTLAVCAEDGAAAVVMALNSETFSKNALQSVNIDVLGVEKTEDTNNPESERTMEFVRTNKAESASEAASESASGSTKESANKSGSNLKNPVNTANSANSANPADTAISATAESSAKPETMSVTAAASLFDSLPAQNLSFYSLRQRYGFCSREHSYCVIRSAESDELAQLADQIGGKDIKRHLSLSIAMVLAAGVRRGTIKSALRVSHELR